MTSPQTRSPDARIRIVHLISGDSWAGAEVMAWNLLSELQRQSARCAVRAICLNEGTLSDRLRRAGVDVQVLPEGRLSFAGILRATGRLLAEDRVDVLHSHRYKEHLLGALLARRTGAKLMATVHGLPEPARSRRVRYRTQAWVTFRLLRHRFDSIVAVSSHLRSTLITRFGLEPAPLHVIPNGIAMPALEPKAVAGDRPLRIGSVGRLVPVKRFELFLEVAAALAPRFPEARFSILGDGPDRERLVARAAALGLSDVFTLVAPMANPWPYYRSLDLYLNTSESEGLPMSVLESMAIEVPVVASAVGGIPQIIRDGADGFLVHAADPQAFAGVCARLLSDPRARRTIGTRARWRVLEEFSAFRMAQQYLAAYRNLAAGRTAERAAMIA